MFAEKNTLDSEQERSLWQGVAQGQAAARERLITNYLPFARMIAATLYANRHFNEIGFDEYMQFATVGLIESVDRFDISREVSFSTYASARVRGAVLNGLESLSEKQQQVSLRKRLMQQRLASLDDSSGDENQATDPFFKLVEVAVGLAVGYMLEGSGIWQEEDAGYVDNVYGLCELEQLRTRIKELVEVLPEQERHVIKSHYFQGHSFEDISDLMKVTRGRVSQIHRKALRSLKEAYDKTLKLDLRL